MVALRKSKDALELLSQQLKSALSPNNVVRQDYLLLDRPLGLKPLLNLVQSPAAFEQTAALGRRRTGHAHRGVKILGGVSLK
jgi:hypothetical protein